MKIHILKTLKLISQDSDKIALNNLEVLINRGQKQFLIGNEFIEVLNQMKTENLISTDENSWYYKITDEGLTYLQMSINNDN